MAGAPPTAPAPRIADDGVGVAEQRNIGELAFPAADQSVEGDAGLLAAN